MKALKWLDEHFEETVLVCLLILICCIELAQVVARNVSFISSLTWAEEFLRFCWIWSVFISLAYTIRKDSMLKVGALVDALPHNIGKIINIFVNLLLTAVMVYLGVYSTIVVDGIKKSGETSPALNWPMWIIYSIMVVGFFLAAVRGVQQIVLNIIHFGKGKES